MKKILEIQIQDIEEKKEYSQIINDVLKQCFKDENLENTNLYVNVILTTPQNIKQINKKYRNIDKATDVLSFPMFEKEELKNYKSIGAEETLGDIIISIQKVEEQAKQYNHSFERELAYMVVHGFFHIIGYDHINEEEQKIMRTKEEGILEKLNITK